MHTRIARLVLPVFFTTLPASPQTSTAPPPADSPVGHWVAEHPSRSALGSWWDFRLDGTLTMHVGAIITSTITRSGDTITSPPVTTTGAPITVTFRVENDTLHLKSPDNQEQNFTRIGSAPSATDPLLGKWKPLQPATPNPDPDIAAQQKLMTNAILAFFPDNTESVRIPFSAFEGTWDVTAHTFHINNQKETYSFQLTGPKLSLGQPPDGRKMDTYIPDPIL